MLEMQNAECGLRIAMRAGLLLAAATTLLAQESPTPSPGASASSGITVLPTATATVDQTASPGPTGTASPAGSPSAGRSVRISFLPPPLEGRISLGIYDKDGKLVRVLHEEADRDAFTVGADGLVTKWDGKNDRDEDLPPGKYRARGYLVGPLKVENIGETSGPTDPNATEHVQVKLTPNPLAKDAKLAVELGVGFDEKSVYLKTMDDLPLFTVFTSPEVNRVFITKNGEKSVDVWQDDGEAIEQVRVSNVDKMMAFDCGEFELK
jgi:hypothetical protein